MDKEQKIKVLQDKLEDTLNEIEQKGIEIYILEGVKKRIESQIYSLLSTNNESFEGEEHS